MPSNIADVQADVAQVQHEGAGRGAGRLVATNLILTAAHILQNPIGGAVLDGWQARLERDRSDRGWRFRRATVIWYDRLCDLALMEIVHFGIYPYFPKRKVRIADKPPNESHPVEAFGYLRAAKTAEQPGEVTVLLGQLSAGTSTRFLHFNLDGSSGVNHSPPDRSGFSGSAVLFRDYPLADAVWIYGVIQAAPASPKGQLMVSRLADVWKDLAFRSTLASHGGSDQEMEDPTGTDTFRFSRLVPANHGGYDHSVLCRIIASTLNAVPVSSLEKEALLPRHSRIDLYMVAKHLTESFQNLCGEIIGALAAGGITNASQTIYGSAARLGKPRILKANTKLASIALDMRELSSLINDILPQQSRARKKFTAILQICASISVSQDFLVVELGVPRALKPATNNPRFPGVFAAPGRIEGVDQRDHWDNSVKLPEYARLQSHLEEYGQQLQSELAGAAKSSF
jgi:hypothetical protein